MVWHHHETTIRELLVSRRLRKVLEIGVALRKAFGVKIEGPKEELKKHFANVRSLAAFVRTGRET